MEDNKNNFNKNNETVSHQQYVDGSNNIIQVGKEYDYRINISLSSYNLSRFIFLVSSVFITVLVSSLSLFLVRKNIFLLDSEKHGSYPLNISVNEEGSNNNISGAEISFNNVNGDLESRVTDDQGNVLLNIPKNEDVEIRIEREGYQGINFRITLNNNGDAFGTIPIFLEKDSEESISSLNNTGHNFNQNNVFLAENFYIERPSCYRELSKVICRFSITNQSIKDENLRFFSSGIMEKESFAIASNGNRYTPSSIAIGNNKKSYIWLDQEIPKNTAYFASIEFDNIPQSVIDISYLEIYMEKFLSYSENKPLRFPYYSVPID